MIETHELRRTFKGRGGTVEAVRGVDLRVEQGQIFGFLGPNGAGKTTTLRMLATLLPPSSGDARVAGVDLVREPQRVRERIGYVAQGGGTDPAVTGRALLLGLVLIPPSISWLHQLEIVWYSAQPTTISLYFHVVFILLVLMAGNSLLRHAYEEAVRARYRFYSYGDAMLIL